VLQSSQVPLLTSKNRPCGHGEIQSSFNKPKPSLTLQEVHFVETSIQETQFELQGEHEVLFKYFPIEQDVQLVSEPEQVLQFGLQF